MKGQGCELRPQIYSVLCNLCESSLSRVHHTTSGVAIAPHCQPMGHDNHEDSYGGHMQLLDTHAQAILQAYPVALSDCINDADFSSN